MCLLYGFIEVYSCYPTHNSWKNFNDTGLTFGGLKKTPPEGLQIFEETNKKQTDRINPSLIIDLVGEEHISTNNCNNKILLIIKRIYPKYFSYSPHSFLTQIILWNIIHIPLYVNCLTVHSQLFQVLSPWWFMICLLYAATVL